MFLPAALWSQSTTHQELAPTVQATPSAQAAAELAEIERAVVSDLEKHNNDSDVVETAIAMKAADKLVAWTKTFVAAPLAIVLAILAWFGVSGIRDLRKIVTGANETLDRARHGVELAEAQAGQFEKERRAMLDVAQQTKTELETQLQQIREDIEASRQLIKSLDVAQKETLKFLPGADLPDAVRDKIRLSMVNFRNYFERLGFKSTAPPPNVTTQSAVSAIAYYDPGSNTIFVHPAYAESEYAILRQYSHYVLMSSRPKNDQWGEGDQGPVALQYGLADYFPASFLNRAKLEALETQPTFGNFVVELDNQMVLQLGELSFGQIPPAQQAWGGLLWELRQTLGQQPADQSVYDTWRSLAEKPKTLIGPAFVAGLIGQVRKQAGPDGEKIVREVLLRRGATAKDLG